MRWSILTWVLTATAGISWLAAYIRAVLLRCITVWCWSCSTGWFSDWFVMKSRRLRRLECLVVVRQTEARSLIRMCCWSMLYLALALSIRGWWTISWPWSISSWNNGRSWLSNLSFFIVALLIWINQIFHVFLIELLRLRLRSLLIIYVGCNVVAPHWVCSWRFLGQTWSCDMLWIGCWGINSGPSNGGRPSHQIVCVDLLLYHHTTPSLAICRNPHGGWLYICPWSH